MPNDVRAREATTAAGTAPPTARIVSPDRYALIEELGAGGMGVVWAAYDRHLDRKVALKLLHDEYFGAADQERLAHEARMMAKLAHPNVVSVFDVGTREGRTFLAMEFVRGQSLVEWLRPRPAWPEVVAVFRDVARGLAAAHAAGIVHRDVKPGNILVGDDGRARIADFGVSRTDDAPAALSGSTTTETAGFTGSPPYMAPEQLRTEGVDTRADQFGLCVALHEALTGMRPFRGETIDALVTAIDAGPPAIDGVPDWLAALVRRGLAARAEDRYSTTEALVAALDGPAPSRRRAGWVAAAGLAIAVPAVLFAVTRAREEPAIACDVEAREAFADTWTPARRAALVAAFAKAGAAEAGETIAGVADGLARAWIARWETSCRAARIEHTWPAELGVRSTTCLGENRIKLRALLGALDRADEGAIATGAELLRRSDPVTPCGDPDVLRGRLIPPRDPARAAELGALDARVTALGVAFGLRRLAEATRDFPALIRDVERAGDPRLHAKMLGFEAILAQQRTDLPAAIAASKRAYLIARRSRDVEAAAEAAADLTWLYGYEKGDAAAGDDWAELALVEIESIPHARVAFRVHSSIGSMAEHRGQFARAIEAQRKALTLIVHYYGDDHYATALARQNLASALNEAGEVDEALPMYRASLAILERDLGERSLAYVHALNYFASMLGHAGELVEARTVAARSVALGRAAGARGSDLGGMLTFEALVLQLDGELDSAVTSLAEAHAAYIEAGDLGRAASALGFLGGVRAELAVRRDDGALEKLALAELERAAREIEKEWTATHPDRGAALQALALLHAERDRCGDALPVARAAISIFDVEVGSPLAADSLVVLGRCLLATGATADAIAPLERAVNLLATERVQLRRATAEAWLGLALLDADQVERARSHLTAARGTLAADPARGQRLVDRIDRALAPPRR